MALIRLFTVQATIAVRFFIAQHEDLVEVFLRACDAARVLALYNIFDATWQHDVLFLHKLTVFNGAYGDVVIDKAEHIEVDGEVAFNLDDIFSAQLAAAGHF